MRSSILKFLKFIIVGSVTTFPDMIAVIKETEAVLKTKESQVELKTSLSSTPQCHTRFSCISSQRDIIATVAIAATKRIFKSCFFTAMDASIALKDVCDDCTTSEYI